MNNINLFHPHENFFVIDSDNMDQVRSQLYGYTIINDVIIEHADALNGQTLNGEGAYIYVHRDDATNTITIHQDFIGTFGLYLYHKDDYFALSNSFITLTEYLKKSKVLTLNRDYANHFIVSGLSPTSYSETLINEIEFLDRCAIVNISLSTRQFTIDYTDYHENTYSPTSVEGLAILDKWYDKWTNRLKILEKNNAPIQFDLSGGFDSRITFSLALGSEIDLNNVFIYSIKDDLHTHTEDYEIASEISRFYDFPLNKALSVQYNNFTVEDSLNISMHLKMGFHTQMHPKTKYYTTKQHSFSGNAGESIRSSHWGISQEEYIREVVAATRPYEITIAKEFADSSEKLLNRAYDKTREKYERYGRPIPKDDYTMFFYRETRCRHHFGRDLAENYLSGFFRHSPLLDPDLHKLKLHDEVCTDKNLLITILLDRYQKDLLKFKFDGGRSIAPNTLAYAKTINQQHPYIPSNHSKEVDTNITAYCSPPAMPLNSNPPISADQFYNVVRSVFNTKEIRDTFASLYSDHTCEILYNDVNKRKYQPLMKAYTVIAICKAYEDTLISLGNLSTSIGATLLQKANAPSYVEKNMLQDPYLLNYITGRIEIQNHGQDTNELKLIKISDGSAQVTTPAWKTNGGALMIHSTAGNILCTLQCVGSGKLLIELRGKDVRDHNNTRIPFWIDYQHLSINNTPLLCSPSAAWHDQPLRFAYDVKDGDLIQLECRWTAHNKANIALPIPIERVSIKCLLVHLLKRIKHRLLG